jgi:hypothetical protein
MSETLGLIGAKIGRACGFRVALLWLGLICGCFGVFFCWLFRFFFFGGPCVYFLCT